MIKLSTLAESVLNEVKPNTDFKELKPDIDLSQLKNLGLNQIANLIYNDWTRVYFGAAPYLDAMSTLKNISDSYGMDSGHSIVAYFLANAATWKGPVAKAIKAELNKRLRSK